MVSSSRPCNNSSWGGRLSAKIWAMSAFSGSCLYDIRDNMSGVASKAAGYPRQRIALENFLFQCCVALSIY